ELYSGRTAYRRTSTDDSPLWPFYTDAVTLEIADDLRLQVIERVAQCGLLRDHGTEVIALQVGHGREVWREQPARLDGLVDKHLIHDLIAIIGVLGIHRCGARLQIRRIPADVIHADLQAVLIGEIPLSELVGLFGVLRATDDRDGRATPHRRDIPARRPLWYRGDGPLARGVFGVARDHALAPDRRNPGRDGAIVESSVPVVGEVSNSRNEALVEQPLPEVGDFLGLRAVDRHLPGLFPLVNREPLRARLPHQALEPASALRRECGDVVIRAER